MDSIFFNDYFQYIYAFGAFWCIFGFGITYFIIRKKGITFPPKSDVDIIYEEKGISGRSHKSQLTKMGGSRNCLCVTITTEELWINTYFPFNLVAYYYDGLHRLPLSSIKNVNQSGKALFVKFERTDGTFGVFELELKNPGMFLNILNKSS